jgi:hypothetical protein
MKYGLQRVTTVIDDNGSTITTETNIRAYKPVKPTRKYSEIRERVKNKKEEMTEYLKFTESMDEKKLDPSFRIERTREGDAKGYYYIVKAWTEVQY